MYDFITIGAATQDVFLRSKAWDIHEDARSPTGLDQCFPFGTKVPVDDITFTTGGGATNAAATFGRLGKLRIACVCEAGRNDPAAVAVLADLKRDGICTDFVRRNPKLPTAYSVILVAGTGERTILVYRGASAKIAHNWIPWSKLRARWFYVTSLGGDLALMRKILAHAKKIGAKVAWNPGEGEIAHGWKSIAPIAHRCAVFNLNREEAAELTGIPATNLAHIINKLRAACTGDIVVTDGPKGAYANDGNVTRFIPGRDIKRVNSTGAGDAFGSAFVLGSAISNQQSAISGRVNCRLPTADRNATDFALRLAMANAEGVISRLGAKAGILSGIPSAKKLSVFTIKKL